MEEGGPARSSEAREGALVGGELASRVHLVEERRRDGQSGAAVWRCVIVPSLPRDTDRKRSLRRGWEKKK